MTLPLLLLAALVSAARMYPVAITTASASPSAVGQGAPAPPPCSPAISWLNEAQLTVLRTSARALSLFSAVEGRRYPGTCESSIQFTAVYMDTSDDVVCSGRVELGIPQDEVVQYTHLEIRPGN